MEKVTKNWGAPRAEVQMFAANEYVAACGDGGVWYKFTCDANAGMLYYYPKGREGRQQLIGDYHPCGVTHEAPGTDVFYDGFVDYNKNGIEDDEEAVIVWRGEWNLNGHATINTDMTEWEISKS